MQLIRDAWAGLSPTGRAVLIVCIAAVLIAAMYFGALAQVLGWLM